MRRWRGFRHFFLHSSAVSDPKGLGTGGERRLGGYVKHSSCCPQEGGGRAEMEHLRWTPALGLFRSHGQASAAHSAPRLPRKVHRGQTLVV